ncbi:MAG: Lrp/AsnC family transcriptional regulator, partial [Pseudonocardiaceae bacterium]
SVMDDLDQRILDLLIEDGRQSVTVMARRLHVARSTLQARITRLERRNVIAGYTVRLGSAATGRRVAAHVAITIDPKRGEHVQQTLRRIADVRTLHTVSGPFDLIAVVTAESTAEVDTVLDRIGGIPGVERTTSSIVLTTKFDR